MDLVDQALDSLRILLCAGWVHRDISSNNLLAFDDNGTWKVKLSDLEFSQTLTHEDHRPDPRTGTPYFMPVEIMMRRHLLTFLRSRKPEPSNMLAKQLSLQEGTLSYERLKFFKKIGKHESLPLDADLDAIPTPQSTVRYNFQHDLESIWWIVLYFIMARVPHKPSQDIAKDIFQHDLVTSPEPFTIFFAAIDDKTVETLHPQLQDSFSAFLDTLRAAMVDEYQIREVFGQLQVPHTYSAIHATFANEFADLLAGKQDDWKDIPILLSVVLRGPKVALQTMAGTKRGRDHDNSHDEDSAIKKSRQNKD